MNKSLLSILAATAAAPALGQPHPATPAIEDDNQGYVVPTQPAPIIVTATRSGDGVPVADLPASVTLLDAPALESRQTRIVSDILRDVPGVAVNRAGAVGGVTQLRLRGSEANHVLVLIDGIEVADPVQGEFDFGTLIADPGARIEVLRGQQSALYGSDAIGGVIHYITATGREAPGIAVRAEGGSFGTLAGAARLAGVAGDLDYAVTGSAYHADGYPTARGGVRDVGADLAGLSAKLSWSPSDRFGLTGVARYNHAEADTNFSEQDPASPRFGLIVDTPGAHSASSAFYGLLRGEFRSADRRFSIAATGQIADSARDSFADAATIDGGDRGRRTKGSLEASYRLGDGRVRHRLTAAFDYELEEYQNRSPFGFDGARDAANLGVVGQYELNVADRFNLGASIRYDRNDLFGDPTTYRVQAGARITERTRIRAAYGTGVKNPGFFELFGFFDGRYVGNPNLRPERSEGWEIGIDQSFARGIGTIGATYFHSVLDDEIFTTFPPPTFVATPGNRTTRSRQQGVELFAQLRPASRLRVDLAYTYLDSTENGVEEVRRPEHVASANLTATSVDERLSGTLTVRYNGRMTDVTFTDPTFATTPVVSLKPFTLVNLAAEYRISDAISLFGRVENLLDEDYEEVFSYVGAGRSAVAGARVRF